MNHAPLMEAAWRDHRPYLVNLAYQLLGDVGEAEDVAQEAFLRLARTDLTQIDDIRGWLTVVGGRLCLDQIRSARARYEQPGEPAVMAATRPAAGLGPADQVTLDDQVRTALFEVLRRLSPGERVAFVLHDVFGVPFDEIAQTVGRPVGTCRQLARRARAKVTAAAPRPLAVAAAEHQLVTETFITACANGDLAALIAVLDPAVWGIARFVGHPAPPPQTNHGRGQVAANLLRFLGHGATLVTAATGQPVVLAFVERQLAVVLMLTVRDGVIVTLEATVDRLVARPGVEVPRPG